MDERRGKQIILSLLLIALLSVSHLLVPVGPTEGNTSVRVYPENGEAGKYGLVTRTVIDANTTWGINQSPILIDSNHSITQGHILNVTAGATIVFMGNYTINVEGELNCTGNLSHPVVITSNVTITNSSASGIRVPPGGEFRINRTEISNLTGIHWEGTGVIANTSFHNCTLPVAFDSVSMASFGLDNVSFNESVASDVALNNSNISILDTHRVGKGNTSVHFNDSISRLRKWITFSVRTYNDTMEALENCQLMVRNGTDTLYSTPHYLGSDPATDPTGRSGFITMLANISARDGWENTTVNITLFFETDLGEWNSTGNLYRADSISPGGELAFISPDIYQPERPASMKIEQLNNTALNISWVHASTPDIVSHGVFYNDTGNWVQVVNTTIPRNFSVYSPVEIGKNYSFKIISYDDMAYASDFTDTVTFTVGDVEAPALAGFGPTGSNVSTGARITMELSEPMDTYSVRGAFSITPIAHLTLDFSNDNRSLNATPFLPLEHSTTYTVNLSKVATDAAGNHLAENISFNFTTIPDLAGPRILSIAPTHLSDGDKVYLDSKIEVRFNEAVNITSYEGSFSIMPFVAGSHVPLDENRTFRFQPYSQLDYDTTYRIVLAPTVTDLANNSLGEHTYYNFTTVSKINISIPEILDYGPVNDGVSIYSEIFLVFSEPMSTDVFAALTITPKIVFAYDRTDNDTKFIFSPVRPLKGSTFYNVSVSVNAKSLAGYSIASPLVFDFTTHETKIPKIMATTPAYGERNVEVDTSIQFRFDEDLFESEDLVINIIPPINFTRIIDNSINSLGIKINGTLAHDTEYSVGVGGLVDVFGNRMEYYTLVFTTKALEKKENPPEVYEYSPLNGSRNVPMNTVISITFYGPLSPDSVNGRTVRLLEDNVTEVGGAIGYDPYDTVISFDLAEPLKPNTAYTVILDGILSSVDLVPMNEPFIFWFMTREEKGDEPIPPTIVSTSPLNGTEIGYNKGDATVWLHFSAPLDPASFPGNVSILPPVGLTTYLEGGNRRLNIIFLEDLLPGTQYVLRIDGGVLDMNGTAMENSFDLTLITRPASGQEKIEKENWLRENLPMFTILILLLLIIAAIYMKPKRNERFPGETPCPHCESPVLKDDKICWHCKGYLGAMEDEKEEVDDGLDEMDRKEMKDHIKEKELDIKVTKKMSDQEIRETIRLREVEGVIDGMFDELFTEEFGEEALEDLKEALEPDEEDEEGEDEEESKEGSAPADEETCNGEGDPEDKEEEDANRRERSTREDEEISNGEGNPEDKEEEDAKSREGSTREDEEISNGEGDPEDKEEEDANGREEPTREDEEISNGEGDSEDDEDEDDKDQDDETGDVDETEDIEEIIELDDDIIEELKVLEPMK